MGDLDFSIVSRNMPFLLSGLWFSIKLFAIALIDAKSIIIQNKAFQTNGGVVLKDK